jgi:cellulose synthase/poly-beta-1,6-N-acetylglucosamine synthase-like glycosyltransferase
METLKYLNFLISAIFFICYFYQICYIPIPLFKKEKPHKRTRRHRYAVLISARNEENVIVQLIESINRQTYPKELVTTFVVADNCTDKTAELARKAGAVVYERFDLTYKGKGYALDYLTEHISHDYGRDYFDAFFVFDADNLLDANYISEMNKTFSDGYQIVTSYRNSKNFGDNWISAGYALWFLRESKYLNNARMLLGTSCAVSGTGFMFSREILEKCGGWKFYFLTEDIEFTVHNVVEGVKIGYCRDAVIYDEQPTGFGQSWAQRMRWSKGYLQVFHRYGLKLIKGIFKGNFSCFDMSMAIMPAIILSVLSIVINITASIAGAVAGDDVLIAVMSVLEMIKNGYLLVFALGAITAITEWSKIHTSTFKKIIYMLTFPVFMFTYVPLSFVSLFKKVEWTPIAHTRSISIHELKS